MKRIILFVVFEVILNLVGIDDLTDSLEYILDHNSHAGSVTVTIVAHSQVHLAPILLQ